eukprot:80456_1
MVLAFGTLSEISIIAQIDGADCDEESFMGYWGLVLWIALAIYLMIGQFVICEEYFVPILAQLGDRWNMAEDVQGATLLAVGSSSPELFTALLGVIFYPNDNPGPGTNVGSAVFNMCIIIGLSAIFAPRSATLQLIPFLRDSIAYIIGLIQLFLFYSVISPGYMDMWESIFLTAWWVLYVVMVYRTDFMAERCCCCIPQTEIKMNETKTELEFNTVYDKHVHVTSMNDTNSRRKSRRSVIYEEKEEDEETGPIADTDQHPDIHKYNNIHIAPGALDEAYIDEDLQQLLDELNRKQKENVNKGWIVVVMPRKQTKTGTHLPVPSTSPIDNPMQNNRRNTSIVSQTHSSYVRRRTLLETLSYERMRESVEHKYDEDHESQSRTSRVLHKCLVPWVKLFHITLPKKEGTFVAQHIYVTIMMLVAWLGILTFFVVDCAEKIGNCFSMPGDLLGITLLAVGSSLPDCISSIIVARQMKIDMAVANAFGSNIFDVNLCVGFSFILGSIAKACQGESTSIFLGDGEALIAFSELILAAAGFMVFLWIMMWCTMFKLEKWIGYVLSMSYVGYICAFTVLFIGIHSGSGNGSNGSEE